MKKYISVDKGAIAKNAANGTNEPVLLVEGDDMPAVRGYKVEIDGPSRLVYLPDHSRVNSAWIETRARVTVWTDSQFGGIQDFD